MGDLNADGYADLVVARLGDGTGAFGADTRYDAGATRSPSRLVI